jgi:hypothetical protein
MQVLLKGKRNPQDLRGNNQNQQRTSIKTQNSPHQKPFEKWDE